ncbi:MAG: ATP-binding cassette domain-containing protein, partial [Acidimicrobiales bacterium]|nr:ATP-binding cassette domain-containing protein [Acidimicrobiales bacterium]
NGAGKTTLMNAIGGFVPSEGRIWLGDRELTSLSPAGRARAGLGRAFQNAELFGDLTVRETVQVALERSHRSSLVGNLVAWPGSARVERRQRERADELIAFLGLGRYADAVISTLSTGTRRIAELACLLALEAPVLCLDEPTAGVAQRETEAFGPLLREIRDQFGITMVVIEHDMPLIMSVSDRVYCMEAGKLIAQGPPQEVRNDPKVIASYLGTDERAIQRSDTAPAPAT